MGGYTTIDALRDEGFTEAQCSDERLATLIELESRRIDQLCSGWFEARQLSMLLDGPGAAMLELPAPIVSVSSIKIDDVPLPVEAFVVYNRHMRNELSEPDDRRWPRIELIWNTGRLAGDLYFRQCTPSWPIGEQNIRVSGVFGWTESDGTTPLLIAHACKLLVVKQIPLMNASDERSEALTRGRERIIRTREQSIEYFASGSDAANGYITGDVEVDAILAHFLPPPRMTVAGGTPFNEEYGS